MSMETEGAELSRADYTYPFLAHIDTQRPPSSLDIAPHHLAAMAPMERQYWTIKARVYNVVLFFKKGKFYELYDNDAVLAHREFGLKLVLDTTNRGKMRLAGVPEQSYREWARLFVFRGYKVGRVEQMHAGAAEDDDKDNDDNEGATTAAANGSSKDKTKSSRVAVVSPSKAKVMPRELVEVLTPGTLTDAAMLSDHSEVYVLALAPVVAPAHVSSSPSLLLVDAVAVDLSRRVVHWCACGSADAVRALWSSSTHADKDNNSDVHAVGASATMTFSDAALRALGALLQQLQPREIIVPSATCTTTTTAATSDSMAAACAVLQRWVAAEGFVAEAVDMSSHVDKTSYCNKQEQQQQQQQQGNSDDSNSCTQSPACVLLRRYFAHLRQHAALPLLSQATHYTDHLTDVTASVHTSHDDKDDDTVTTDAAALRARRVAAATSSSLLAWERRHDRGLVLDAATVSNLELVANLRDGSAANTLHAWLNGCCTNAGKRLLRRWLLRPSASLTVLRARQAVVRFLCDRPRAQQLLLLHMHHDTDSDGGGAAAARASAGGKRTRDAVDKNDVDDSAAAAIATARAVRYTCLANVDLERSLSRLAEMKAESRQHIAYVDPLVRYRRHLDLIVDTVQALDELTQWARAFRAQCAESEEASEEEGTAAQTRHDDGDDGNDDRRRRGATGLPVLLDELLSCMDAAAPSAAALTRLYDRAAVRQTGLLVPVRGACAAYDAAVDELAVLQTRLDAVRSRVQHDSFADAPVHFVDLGKDLFLLEVAASSAPAHTPHGLIERARSGKSVKYVMPALAQLIDAHKAAAARKAAALLTVLYDIAEHVCAHCHIFVAANGAMAYLDCLATLARLRSRYASYSCLPQLCSGRDEVAAAATAAGSSNTSSNENSTDEDASGVALLRGVHLLHPMLLSDEAVANTVQLDAQHGRVLVLTGPNMAGKSTLMRTVAVNVLLAQLGGPVLARTMTLAPVDRIYTRIGARDASHKGQSTLYVELSETAELLRGATARSLCLLDELGRGTSTHDGLAVAHATLHTLLERHTPLPPLTIFSTHYHALALEQAREEQQQQQQREDACVTRASRAQLGYMDFAMSSAQTHMHDAAAATSAAPDALSLSPRITFLYRLVRGVCTRSYGVEVALLAGIPRSLVHLAKAKSDELARRSALHEDVQLLRTLLLQQRPHA